MNIAFTICANNYLAHAKTLVESFKKFHPDIPIYIGLVDKRSNLVDYGGLGGDGILDVVELLGSDIEQLSNIYGIAEFCTVVKPSLMEYLRDKVGASTIIYLDPDIEVFSRFDEVLKLLKTNDIVLTPHMCSPTGEEGHPMDKDIMRTGVYNLGFVALNVEPQSIREFLRWWDKRVRSFGFHDLKKGYFYDQIWLSYAPCFLDNVAITRHLGYNAANWNFHERVLVEVDGKVFVNSDDTPLRFLHYSHFKPEAMPEIASYNDKFDLNNREDLRSVFESYVTSLERNGWRKLKSINYVFGRQKPLSPRYNRLQKVAYYLKKSIITLLFGEKE